MRRDTMIQLAAGGVLAASLGASGVLATQITASAGQNRLVYTDTAEEGAPTEVGIGIAMGAFRGIFVNYLWIRANDLKEAGKYYEAVDLARAITRLQPRFPRVWVFHAWNLAYNISVTTQTPAERWNWVRQGIELLRDQGIPANPTDVLIHRELAWIYLHKVQGYMDDAHHYYKRQHALEWTIVLGPPPVRTREIQTTEQMVEAYVAWLSRVDQATNTLSELYTREPSARAVVEALASRAGPEWDIRISLYNGTGTGAGERILGFIEEQRSLGRVAEALEMSGQRPDINPAVFELFRDPQLTEGWRALALHLRKRILNDKYKMQPDRMIRYTRKYGPMDWRHPAAHSLYWSARGVEEALRVVTDRNKDDFDFVNADRVTIQSVQELYRTGEIYFDILNPEVLMQAINADFIDSYEAILGELIARSKYDVQTRIYTLYNAGYENFLRDVIRFLYRRGEPERAQRYLTQLRQHPSLNENRSDADVLKLSRYTLAEFVEAEIRDEQRFNSPVAAQSEIDGALQSAFISGLRTGNTRLYQSQIAYARRFHEIYTNEQVFNVAVNRDGPARLEQIDRNFDDHAGRVLGQVVMMLGLPDGAIIYRRAPVEYQRWAYYMLQGFKRQMDAQAGTEGSNFDTWFPPPAGIERFMREQDERLRRRQTDRPGVEMR